MPNVFLISDTHFGHENAWAKFQHKDGGPLRPFKSTQEMDEAMIAARNSVVGQNDIVYHLGDFAMNPKKYLPLCERLLGRKRLCMGNHDTAPYGEYLKYFEKVEGYHLFDGMILSHMPIHPASVGRFGGNAHGHLHDECVLRAGTQIPDPRYFCVSVERINYTPIPLEEVRKHFPKA